MQLVAVFTQEETRFFVSFLDDVQHFVVDRSAMPADTFIEVSPPKYLLVWVSICIMSNVSLIP